MTLYAILFALAAMGINETVYLVRKRLAQTAPVCPIGDNCEVVLTSKHSNMFLVPLDVLGLIFYVTVALISSFAVVGIGSSSFLWIAVRVLVGAGAVMSLFFTYLQWRVIRAWCFWCLSSAFTVWTMGVIIVLSKLL